MKSHALTRYSAVSQALHWATAIFVLAAFVLGPGGSEQRVYSAANDFDRQLHETLGLCVFALLVLRVVWRALSAQPEPEQMARWVRITSKAVQGLIYLLLFAVPVTAILGAWLEGHPLTLLGAIEIAPLLVKSHDLGSSIAEVHTILGDAILWLAGLHAAAALYHHFFLKDGVLVAMLPLWISSRMAK